MGEPLIFLGGTKMEKWDGLEFLEPHSCKNWKSRFSRSSSAGFTSKKSFACIELDRSSTEKGMLELSSNKKELLSALFESSVIKTLMLAITSGDTLRVL